MATTIKNIAMAKVIMENNKTPAALDTIYKLSNHDKEAHLRRCNVQI
jgi:hypothetical protein